MAIKIFKAIRANFSKDRRSPFWKEIERETKIRACKNELKEFGERGDLHGYAGQIYRIAKRQQDLLEKK